jgi:CheY-like chemotaxis protein
MEIQEENITCAYCGEEAIREIEKNIILNRYDPESKLFQLIITDYCIPRLSGIEVLTKAKLLFELSA